MSRILLFAHPADGRRALAMFAVVVLFAFALELVGFEKDEIPPYVPDGDTQHEGQPQWCQRQDTKYKANCTECARTCEGEDESEDASCKTHCRRGACSCHPPCQT